MRIGVVTFPGSLDLQLETLSLTNVRDSLEAETGQCTLHRLSLRVEDLGLEHDVDYDACHWHSRFGVVRLFLRGAPQTPAGPLSVPGRKFYASRYHSSRITSRYRRQRMGKVLQKKSSPSAHIEG